MEYYSVHTIQSITIPHRQLRLNTRRYATTRTMVPTISITHHIVFTYYVTIHKRY